MKLKVTSMSYTLPRSFFKHCKISDVRISEVDAKHEPVNVGP
jgi:hypothetical protein